MKKSQSLEWKVNTPDLFKELLENNEKLGIFVQPLNIFLRILVEIAERASDLRDPQLIYMCMRLALYEVSDPYNPAYDKKIVADMRKRAKAARKATE